ncbi:MAG: metal-dependent transcriptional regulator [Erysipelotrichaceae bacterium]|nr:metal-dependent transcriptional regulator [Erysipelotrichaceae bacterium]
MKRTESQEMYLETILLLSKKKPVVRAVDIANELGYKKPSITLANRHMLEDGLITITPEGYIYLTPLGQEIALSVYERHETITQLLIRLGVPEDVAEKDACRIEHVISEETFNAIKKHGT